MGQLEQFVRTALKQAVAEEYPHLDLPGVVCAVIESAKELPDTYKRNRLSVRLEGGGEGNGTYTGTITGHYYEYTVRITDRAGNVDERFPVIPGIRSENQFQVGALVAVGLLFGDLTPVLIGEVEL